MELGSGIDERRSRLLPVAPIGELPPPDFGVEESAICAARSAIAQMQLTQTAGEAAVECLPGGKVITAVLKKVREQDAVQC